VKKLKWQRLHRGWRQADLAYRSRLSVGDISKIETGRMRPYPSQVSRLAKALELSPDELLDEVDEVGAELPLAAT